MHILRRLLFAVAVAFAGSAGARAELTLANAGAYLPLTRAVAAAPMLFSYAEPGGAAPDSALWRRLAGLPFPFRPDQAAALRRVTGIDAGALRAALTFGQPPHLVQVYAGTPALARDDSLAGALAPRGFARTAEAGRTIWHRFEDGAVNIRQREIADPFGGQLGQSARIAARQGEIVGSAFWDSLRGALAAIDGTAPRFADVAEFVAAVAAPARAVAADGLTVVQAMGFHVGHVGANAPDLPLTGSAEDVRAAVQRLMAAPADPAALLPPYVFAVVADAVGREREAAVVALSYSEREAAEQARAVLDRRLAATGAPLGGARARTVILALEAPVGGRQAWAVVAVAARAPAADDRTLYRDWTARIFARDFRLIALAP